MSVESNGGVVVGMHYFQPPRNGSHHEVMRISTDVAGVDWTARVNQRVYRKHARQGRGVLEEVSFTLFPTLDLQLQEIDRKTSSRMRARFPKNGIGSPFVHGIMSAGWTREDIEINIDAGNRYLLQHTGTKPKYLWTGEGAYDNAVLDVLSVRGQNFICGPEELFLDNGGSADNKPVLVRTPSGNEVVGLPFDRDLSGIFAFDKDAKKEAPGFAERHLKWRLNGSQVLVLADGETNGWWDQRGDIFLAYLVKKTEIAGQVISINAYDTNRPLTGILKKERTAWSCPHPDVRRWHGACGCHGEGLDLSWKKPYYEAQKQFNEAVTEVIKGALGSRYQDKVVNGFEAGYLNPGINFNSDYELSAISSKVSALLTRNSCATFFESIYTSGLINLVFARQSIIHMAEAGLKAESGRIEEQYIENMRLVEGEFREGRTGADVYLMLIGRNKSSAKAAA